MITDTLYGIGHQGDGKILVGGVFRMYIERGFPIADSIKLILDTPNLSYSSMDIIFDALGEGWDDIKITNLLYEAYRDANIPQPPYPIEKMIMGTIMQNWNKSEPFDELGKRMVRKYRQSGFSVMTGRQKHDI